MISLASKKQEIRDNRFPWENQSLKSAKKKEDGQTEEERRERGKKR
jgi:hypothetical protein